MKLSKELQEDLTKVGEHLNKALSQAPKKELNELIWQLAFDYLALKDAKETVAIINKFHKIGIKFYIAPSFKINALTPFSEKKKGK